MVAGAEESPGRRRRPGGRRPGDALEIVRGGETEEESRRRGEGESRAGSVMRFDPKNLDRWI